MFMGWPGRPEGPSAEVICAGLVSGGPARAVGVTILPFESLWRAIHGMSRKEGVVSAIQRLCLWSRESLTSSNMSFR